MVVYINVPDKCMKSERHKYVLFISSRVDYTQYCLGDGTADDDAFVLFVLSSILT